MGDPLRNQNESTVVGLPPNQSLVVADSRQRSANENETPYSFKCICNSGIVAKEVIYSRLVWNQPLFTHNNTNNELIFQLDNDTTRTYVAYAPPFITFLEFDGNNNSSVGLTPQIGSYAYAMERMLNTQVRQLPLNTILTNNSDPLKRGKCLIYPSNGIVTIYFRYSSSQGFFIYCQYINSGDPTLSRNVPIRILPCNYLNRGNSIHGFGILDKLTQSWQPRSSFVPCYYSDSIPTLLSFDAIAVTSHQLTKDRRLNSFHSIEQPTNMLISGDIADDGSTSATLYQGSAEYDSELAIFPVSVYDSCVRHEEVTGLDGTVVSLRWGYQPQEFDISILKGQTNEPLRAGDPIRILVQDGSITNDDLSSLIPYIGNLDAFIGNANIQNALLFGNICNPFARLDDPYGNDRQQFFMNTVRPTPGTQNWYYSWNVRLQEQSQINSGINVADCVSSNTFPLDISCIFYVSSGQVSNTPLNELYGITGLFPKVNNLTGLPTNYFGGRYPTQSSVSIFQWIITAQYFCCSASQSYKAQAKLTPKFNGLDSLQVRYQSASSAPFNWPAPTSIVTSISFYYFDGIDPTSIYTRIPIAYIDCGTLSAATDPPGPNQFTWKANIAGRPFSASRVVYLNPEWPGTPDYPTVYDLINHFVSIHSPMPILVALTNYRSTHFYGSAVPDIYDVPQGPDSALWSWQMCSVPSTATFNEYAPVYYKQYIQPANLENQLLVYRYSNPESDALPDDLLHEIGVNVGEGY